jgi:hypothetical protein
LADFRFLAPVAVLLGLLLVAPPASASHVHCGDVITQDTKLDDDLINCPGDGIVIGSDGVSLDLAGHLVDGQSELQDPSDDETKGISANGFNDLVIRNGRVNGFLQGVSAVTSRSTVRGVTVTSCCGLNGGVGIRGDDNLIERNATVNGGGDMGVFGNRNVVSRNLIASQLEDSWLSVSGSNVLVERNQVRAVSGAVCRAFDFFPLDRSLVTRNVVAGMSTGVSEGECFGFVGRGESTRFERNTASGESTGFGVGGGHVLERNVASGNNWNGIDTGVGVTLSRNTANDNGNLGIDALGATDGGGNRARHNRNPAQCVGVSCR